MTDAVTAGGSAARSAEGASDASAGHVASGTDVASGMDLASGMESVTSALAEVGRSAVARGLALASGGNLSARLPGDARTFAITAAGARLDDLGPEQFCAMTLAGETVTFPGETVPADAAAVADPAEARARRARPSSEWKLHQRIYRARPDVNAVVHLHPQYAVLLDALGHRVRMMTLDHAAYVRSVGTVAYHPNGSDALADEAAAAASEHDCLILSHHGCAALGETVEMAHRRALNLEEAATATYRALLLGDTETAFPAAALADIHHA
ncbi:class II aldolase/adducin family protein [Brevibacterium album]|uniref:class II aldolase/adducin family protein n=1 Tax=Brevibacterium album TaxID=417948 RepID=UPI000403C145|nr:class II aldolase/adducin family protein [Brevibacterium album]